MHLWPPRCPTLARLFYRRSSICNAAWSCRQPKQKPDRAPARYLPHQQMAARRWYGTPGRSATRAVGSTSVWLARCSRSCCQSASKSAIIVSIQYPRAPMPSLSNSHGTVPMTRPSALDAVSSAWVRFRRRGCALYAPFPSAMVQIRRRKPALPAPFPQASAQISRWGYPFDALAPSTMAREPAFHALIPPDTPRAAMRMLLRRVPLLSELVHPLFSRTMWLRSV